MVCGHIVLCYHPTGKTVARYGFSFAAPEHFTARGPYFFSVSKEFCPVCRGRRDSANVPGAHAIWICCSGFSAATWSQKGVVTGAGACACPALACLLHTGHCYRKRNRFRRHGPCCFQNASGRARHDYPVVQEDLLAIWRCSADYPHGICLSIFPGWRRRRNSRCACGGHDADAVPRLDGYRVDCGWGGCLSWLPCWSFYLFLVFALCIVCSRLR